jgi:hypothetical protein
MASKYLSSRIVYSILLYSLLIIVIFINKPSFMFDNRGKIKCFGLAKSEGETVYSMGVFVVVMAIISFYIFCMVDLIF